MICFLVGCATGSPTSTQPVTRFTASTMRAPNNPQQDALSAEELKTQFYQYRAEIETQDIRDTKKAFYAYQLAWTFLRRSVTPEAEAEKAEAIIASDLDPLIQNQQIYLRELYKLVAETTPLKQ